MRSIMKRSLSDGNINRGNNIPLTRQTAGQKKLPNSATSEETHQEEDALELSDSVPVISACESDMSFSRCTPTMPQGQIFAESQYLSIHKSYDSSSSNFLDLEWLSSSGNSCEEEIFDRYTVTNSPTGILSAQNVIDGLSANTSPPLSENGSSIKGKDAAEMPTYNNGSAQSSESVSEFSDRFVRWVIHGDMLCY